MATTPIVVDTDIQVVDLTSGSIDGTGVFDKLMVSVKAHLTQEYRDQRIKGPEFATVYLGALDNVLNTSVQFLLQKARVGLEAQLLEQQIILAGLEVQKMGIALEILAIEKEKAAAEVLQVQAQTLLIGQQKINLTAEALNIPKQGLMIEAQTAVQAQQKLNLAAEALNIPKQGLVLDAQKAQVTQQTLNLVSEELGIKSRTALTTQQQLNAVVEGTVLVAQECKLRAEYDLTVNKSLQTTAEIGLLGQKTATEKAQVQAIGVDPDSVIGKQKALYQAQTDGFARDSELKAAKMLVDTWSTRRMTDDAIVVDDVNKLNDATIGRAVTKVLVGINA